MASRHALACLLLAALACSTPATSSPLRGDSPVVVAMENAAARHGVPIAYLVAIAYVESRFEMRVGDEASFAGGHGMLHLVEGSTLDRAVALTGADEEVLRTDLASHVDGAAAVLAELRREHGSWPNALALYGPGSYDQDAGLRYVDAIESLVRDGLEETDRLGRSIVLRAQPSAGPSREELEDAVGAVSAEARPDYSGARWVGPACEYTNASRGAADIDYVIIHTCQGAFSGCWGWLKACGGANASVHYVVSSGGDVVQIVEEQDIAWHDGCFNSRTVGIEHEGFISDPGRWYTEAMYCASARLTRSICDRNRIPIDRAHIMGHNEAPDCSDHTDPGSGWNWSKYMEYVRCGCGGCCTPGRTESCNNADDDCDGRIDEGLSRGCGSDVGACRRGTQTCSRGSWGSCAGEIRPASESCNGVDDDCDGSVDDGLRRGCGTDVGECVAGTQSCNDGDWGSCEGAVDPIRERCDELDNDCDGETDDEDVCEIEELVLQPKDGPSLNTDVDGDGRSDACASEGESLGCHLASGHGFERSLTGPELAIDGFGDPSHFSTLRMGDVDGDGRADACIRASEGVRCWTSNGDTFGTVIEGPALSDDAGFREAAYFTTVRLADVDGDGLADLCARWADGLHCYRSTGNGFEESHWLPDLADDAGFAEVAHYGTLRLGDIDGDGRADVCARQASGVTCWRSEGRDFGDPIAGPRWRDEDGFDALDIWSTLRLADVNGDGRADLCARTPSGFECHPSTGRGFGDPLLGPTLSDADGWSEKSHFATLRLGDIDADGRADLCGRGRGGVTCWLASERGFDQVIDGPSLRDADGWTDASWFRTFRLADVTGDGRADICARDDVEGLRCWRSDGRGFPVELPGPTWTAGWGAPERFGSIRLAGLGGGEAGPDLDGGDPGPGDSDGGCSCSTTANDSPVPRAPALLLLCLFAARLRRRTQTETSR